MTAVAARRRVAAVAPELIHDGPVMVIPFPSPQPSNPKSARQRAHEARERERLDLKAYIARCDRLRAMSDEELDAEIARVCGDTPWEAMTLAQKETQLERTHRESRRAWAGREPFAVVQKIVSPIERRLAANVMLRALALLRMTPAQLVAHPLLAGAGQWMTADDVLSVLAGERFPEHLVVYRLESALRRHCERRYGVRIRPSEAMTVRGPRPPRYERRLLAGLFELGVLALSYGAMLVEVDTEHGRLDYNDKNGPLGARIRELTALFPEVR